MEAIASLIQPVPDLENNSPSTAIRIKARALYCRLFHNKSIVVADAADEGATWPKFSKYLLRNLQQLLIGVQVGKRVVHTNHASKLESGIALSSIMFATENGTLSPRFAASKRAR